jgi:molybdopterin molybdotransferase
MPEFLTLTPYEEALQKLISNLKVQPEPEWVPLTQAWGRVTFSDVLAPYPLPSFPRSTVDGYAVRAQDTFGASESLPIYLTLAGEIPMGAAAEITLQPGSCALIHTGGMLPEKADAVVMVEYTQIPRTDEVEILRAAAEGENIIKIGEDVAAGECVIPLGRRLRPAEVGGLAALGISQIQVSRKPRVAILSSGDEVVPVDQPVEPGQVRDTNTHTLSALVQQAGGEPKLYGILPDKVAALTQAAQVALFECDMLVITAGSSASTRDLTADVINALGQPGVLVHGVNIRPGKPTILAVCNQTGKQKPVIGLPGNPVSALVIAGLFITPVIRLLLGIDTEQLIPSKLARLSINLPSQSGREEWLPVRLIQSPEGWLAEPVFGKSNLIFTLVRADGMLRIPPNAAGLAAGEIVEVFLYT